jgi:vitamin B12 transporter
LFFLSAAPSLYAEDAGVALPKIVITADKRETLEENVAASVSVITRKDIEAQVGTTVPEVLRNLAGVNVQSVGSPGDDTNLRIRGSDQDEVLVLLDGVPMNNIREHRTQFLGDIPLEIVERIEVVRGPQSVLYGSDAVGGVVNIITRKGTKQTEVPVSFEAGNLGTFREVLGVSGSSKKTQYFTNFTRMDQKGSFPHNSFGGWTLDGSFSYQFSPNVEMNVGATYLSNNQDLYYEFTSSFDPDLSSLLVKINPDGNNALHRDMLVAHANVKATIRPWWNLELLYGLFIDQDSNFNSDVGDTAPPPFVPGAQDFQGSGVEHTVDLRNVFNLHKSKNFLADFLLGFEFQQESLKFDDLVSGLVFPDAGQKGSRQNYAPYFLFNFGFFDQKLLLSGGARYDHNTTFGHEWSPRGSVLYKLDKTGTRFRASYGEGFHGPTILDFFTEVLQQQLGLPFQAARLQA